LTGKPRVNCELAAFFAAYRFYPLLVNGNCLRKFRKLPKIF
jgi:hypothetical protein